MTTEQKYFFLKLNPPRPSFAMDMTDEEKRIMQEHITYWNDLLAKGIAIVFGPVFEPSGVFGIGIVTVKDEQSLQDIEANDPALKAGNRYEAYPMMAVVRQ